MSGSAFAVDVDGNALPSGGQVRSGEASFDYGTANELHVHQGSERVFIDWDSFNIGRDALTEFHQKGSGALAVNRVVGGGIDPTQILGRLKANGQVIVLDRNGIIFGKDATIDVGGIIAASGDMDIERVMSGGGRLDIADINPDGFVVNEGAVTARDAGLVAFVAPAVVNNGTISARLGRVQIGAGERATIDLYGDGLMEVELDEARSQAIINNGLIDAQGGQIQLTAAAAKDVVDNLVLNTGVVTASSFSQDQGGRIILSSGHGRKTGAQGGGLTVNQGLIAATGFGENQRGGQIDILGDAVVLDRGSLVDASGYSGGGDIRIGGDYLGRGDTPTAQYAYVDLDAYIFNDAIVEGNGGRTIVWSDDTTDFYGHIFGRGGALGGNGGFVETSGKINLLARGSVDLTAANGAKGTYLLDPATITIYGNFDPTDVGSGRLWLDASQITGRNNGDSVSVWDDMFGTNDATAFATGPTYLTNTLNGQPVLRFANMNGMQTPTMSFTDWSIFMVFRDTSNQASYERLLDHDYVNGFWFGRNNSTASSFGGGVKESADPYGRFVTVTDGQWNLIGNQRSNTTHTIWANGNFSGGSSGTVTGAATSVNRLGIGMWHNNGTPGQQASNIDIAEVIVYSDDLSSSDRNLIEQYQSAKWGISLTPPGTGGNEAAKAMASDGYGSFTTRYLERLSNSADIVLQATNAITLDLQGDTLNLAHNRNITLTTTNGNITDISAGTIRTTRTGTGGNIALVAGGAGSITLDTTNLEALGGGTVSLSATGGAVSLAQTSALNLGNVTGQSINLQSAGTIGGSGKLTTSGGNMIVNASSDLDASGMGLVSGGGNMTLNGRDIIMNTSVNAGTGTVTLNATRDIFVDAIDLSAGLAGYWNFDEGSGTTAGDSSGNVNAGTLNGPAWSADTPFGAGYSLSFDGTNDYVAIADSNTLDLTTGFTISLWVQSGGVQSNRYLLSKRNDAGSDNVYSVLYGYAANQAQFYASGNSFGYPAASSNISVPDTSWHLLTYTYDGGTYSAYKDGTLINSVNLGANITASTSNLLLGTFNAGGYYFNGLMDDVRIYNNALTSGQIAQLQNPAWISGSTSFNAARDITLDDRVSATNSGNALTLSAGRNFINNAGGGALETPSGRWLVYSSDPSANTLGGLSADFKRYNKTYAGYAPASVTETNNGLLYSIAPVLTVTAQNKTREYGDANPAFTSTVTGLIDGDTSGAAISGSPSFAAAGVSANTGTSAITPSVGTLASALGYQFTTFINGTLTITSAPLVVTATDQERLQGTANPLLTGIITGFKAGDTASVLDTQPVYTTAAGPGSSSGLYAITPSGAADSNYSFTYVNGILTVKPAAANLPPSLITTSTQQVSAPYSGGGAMAGILFDERSPTRETDDPTRVQNNRYTPDDTLLNALTADGLLEITPEARKEFNLCNGPSSAACGI